jgi:hypothetical protein
MFLVRYELGFISQKKAFFIVTAVKISNLTSGGTRTRKIEHHWSSQYALGALSPAKRRGLKRWSYTSASHRPSESGA